MIRRPPRSTQSRSSAASDVYKRQAIDRVPGCHLDIIGDALHALDAVRKLAERRGDQHLPLLLKRAHAAAVGLRGAADQDHRPAVLLSIGKTRETVHHA